MPRTAFLLLLLLPFRGMAVESPADAHLRPDAGLQQALARTIQNLGLDKTVSQGRLAVSLVDVTDSQQPHYAALNDRVMMYAASLPKIAILVAGFERIRAGLMEYTPAVREMFIRLTRYSSNADASRAIHTIGFDYIAAVLTSPQYLFYDPQQNGGLWLGKAYGGPNDHYRRDPLHNISHGATSFEVARFFVLLEQGRLVNPHYSAEIKDILSKPAIHHKFVKGLESKGEHIEIYRKSGTWTEWHSDAALVEHNGKKYVAVALMHDAQGGDILPKLIVKLDSLICDTAD
jgi:beta-lactamase class A